MSRWLRGPVRGVSVALGIWVLVVGSFDAAAQQGGRGGRQGGAASARAAAPVDLTGLWTAVVTEDWRWRMLTPQKGDYSTVQAVMTPEARKVADAWDPARDTAAGEQCRAYGAAAVMRIPGRIRISWENDATLKVETEAGTQTRLLQFGAVTPGAASWQGTSAATWLAAGGGGRRGGGAGPRAGALRVVTTNLRPGYLRKNGVPYGADARLTEHFHRLDEENGDSWLLVTTLVEDPQYLTTRYQVSTHFKKVADGSGWNPTPCSAT